MKINNFKSNPPPKQNNSKPTHNLCLEPSAAGNVLVVMNSWVRTGQKYFKSWCVWWFFQSTSPMPCSFFAAHLHWRAKRPNPCLHFMALFQRGSWMVEKWRNYPKAATRSKYPRNDARGFFKDHWNIDLREKFLQNIENKAGLLWELHVRESVDFNCI